MVEAEKQNKALVAERDELKEILDQYEHRFTQVKVHMASLVRDKQEVGAKLEQLNSELDLKIQKLEERNEELNEDCRKITEKNRDLEWAKD
jgi:chromosome segregation ATPase